jgi:ribose transport system substrate-binding protein
VKKSVTMLMVLLLVVALLFVGCGGGTEPAESSAPATSEAPATSDEGTTSGDKPVLGVAMLDMTQEFFVNMIEAGNQAAEDADVEIIWKSADSNLDKQIALIENYIEQKVNCILIDPYDAAGLISVCEKAQAAGIPVISMGNFIDSEAVTSNLYNDYEDTKVIGEIVANMIDKKGEVAMLYGAAGNFVSDERQRGWEEAMAEFPDITNTSLPVGWDTAETLKVTQDLLASNPDIVAIHSFSDGNTVSVLKAVEQAGKQDSIIISSYDGNKDASEAVEEGDYLCTLLTGSKRVGYWNVWLGAKLAKGEKLDQKNYLKSHFIMTDELKAKVEEWGIGYEGMSIVTPAEGITMFDDYAADFQD